MITIDQECFFFYYYLLIIYDTLFASQGRESFASRESLEQLHRFIFVLGVTHVSYSFIAIALAMIKVEIRIRNTSL